MSNTSLGRGEKGSKFWMQMIPNTLLKEEFDRFLGDEVKWLSPLKGEEYREYELREPVICDALEITDPLNAFDFWPHRQPQWDGIAVSDKTNTLYLVEAKAHLKELESNCSASESSKAVIESAMRTVHEDKYRTGNFDLWMKGYYQLGNRLTFLQKMKDFALAKYPNVKLILLNFVNDYTYRPTALVDWRKHYEDVFRDMTGSETPPSDVFVMYYDVKGEWFNG